MAKSSARLLWAARLSSKNKKGIPSGPHLLKSKDKAVFKGIILGIDPSLRGTGMALLKCQGKNEWKLIDSKIIKIHSKFSMSDCC